MTTNICTYGCGIILFWNTETSEYWEIFTEKKHICPNRLTNANTKSIVLAH